MHYAGEVTDSLTQVGEAKKDRLVAGAASVLHRRGVRDMTLAEVAKAAEMPRGNLYYYFKTRDELVEAVIASHGERLRQQLEASDELPDPAERLKSFVRSWSESADLVAAEGCPIGSLCSELNKLDGEFDRS